MIDDQKSTFDKQASDNVRTHFEALASQREAWIRRNKYFYQEDWAYMGFLAGGGGRVLELGCGTGSLLASLEPDFGVGVDISPAMIENARAAHPGIEFHIGDMEDPEVLAALPGPFDTIILSDGIGTLQDCQRLFDNLHQLCHRETRVVVAYYSHLWEPLLFLAEKLGRKMPQLPQSWMSTADISNILDLSGFETVRTDVKQIIPRRLLGLGTLINRYIGSLPGVRALCLRQYVVGRSMRHAGLQAPSASIIVPCRNESGNIEAAIIRTPKFCEDIEFIFVEGNSTDDTWAECQRVKNAYPNMDINILQQDGRGKGDAMRKGYDAARGDILMVLDADLTMPPEWLPKFYDAIVSGKGEFINGSRLVYPCEKGAMQFLNSIANRAFAIIFSYLLNQRFTDTLCGTKVLRRAHYQRIATNRVYFGDFDPFGDFDLIFGAVKLNLKVTEIPIRYADRTYGATNISRFRHGCLLLRMVLFAYRKLKAL
jgi:SAM-dependent methyltransferase